MSAIEELNPGLKDLRTYEYGWSEGEKAGVWARRRLTKEVVCDISGLKTEPPSLLELRLKGLKPFGRKPMPNWGLVLTRIAFQIIPTVRGGAAL